MITNKAIFCGYEEGRRSYVSTSVEVQSVLGGHEIHVKVFACNISEIHHDVLVDLLSRIPNFSYSPSTYIGGEVIDVGSNVTSVKIKDKVVGFVPLDSARSCCANYCILNDFDAVVLPQNMDLKVAVAAVSSGVKAYHALQYLARVNIFDTILIFDAATASGSLSVQLSKLWGAKVLAVASRNDKLYLENLPHPPDHIIETESLCDNICNIVVKETGGIGSNVIIDNGVRLFSNEGDSTVARDDTSTWKPLKQEIISCLATNGRWITSHPLLQIDPADSMQLFLLGSSVNFLFEHLWSLAPISQGKLIHIMKDLVKKIEECRIEPHITQVIMFDDFIEAIDKVQKLDQTIISFNDV